MPDSDRRLHEFVCLFNEEKFFEAHEVLEALWREENGEARDFYQGLIQIAAAFVHYQKNNPAGYEALVESASAYLQPYDDGYQSFPLKKLLEETRRCFRQKRSVPKIVYGK
ncbi:MAG TPA: DUF309 domain-containing protein [Verrucomicrobiae bacterium]|nr:DUF309 domain-containing protein [Verrucomicrobiae bacterium]